MQKAELERRLTLIGQALRLDLSAEQRDQLAAYMRLLAQWGSRFNLTALRDPEQVLGGHLADCMAAAAPLQRWLGSRDAAAVLDVGSGAGLPGVIFAILCPALRVTCVDAAAKKAAFITQVAAELRLPLRSEHCRVEQMRGCFDVICTRAFASLAQTVRLTHHLLEPSGSWLAMKGKVPHGEMAELPATVQVFHVEPLQVPAVDAERCLVWMRLA